MNKAITRQDTGLGTTYERWALNRWLSRFSLESGILNALEGPGDGMTGIAGINSLPLALSGVQVTLALPDPARADYARAVWAHHAPRAALELHTNGRVHSQDLENRSHLPYSDNSFDLVWNFNVINRQPEPEGLLAEMRRVSRRWVLIFVPNRRNYGFSLHRLHHRVANQPWDHGSPDLLQPAPWKRMAQRLGLQVQEVIHLDCPWWPDIIDLGEMLSDFFPFLRNTSISQRAKPTNRYCWEADSLPYYRPRDYPQVHRRLKRLGLFEDLEWEWLKARFAHHIGILAYKR